MASTLQVRLDDKDRAGFGCAEWLDLDVYEVTIDQLETICAETDMAIDDWPEVLNAKLRFEDVDKPGAQPRRPPWSSRVIVWLALNQSGHDVPWAGVGKVKMARVFVRGVETPKDDGDPALSDSPNSDADTTPSSVTSSPE